jgi:MYXO-CTERM domain-containing protein
VHVPLHPGGRCERTDLRSIGGLDAGYRPDPSAGPTLERLAAATGGRVWPLSAIDDAANALREAVDAGPTTSIPASSESQSLAAFPAGLALALTAVLAIGAARRRRVRSAVPVPLSR